MRSFIMILSLFFSLNSLGSTSCKDQKKLLKSACSFKKEKIKSKNRSSLNSCKKIKDLFLDLKTKTKENYESCEKAYEKCNDLCHKCNKSLLTSFKEKSKKNLKKIKGGFKKASKCLNQLSSDFEEKDQSFIDQYDHKKFLEFLKKQDLRKIKEEKRRHEEFLKKQKENRIIRQKLRKVSKKVFERQALSDWARKHKVSVSGKSTEELKQLKIDYEIKQIKKEGKLERLKLKTQRRERLKKKFEADFLKTNPPKTKTTMAIESVKEVLGSYWASTKGVFRKLSNMFLGHFAVAENKAQCKIIKNPSYKEKKELKKLELFAQAAISIEEKLDEIDISPGSKHNCKELIEFLDYEDLETRYQSKSQRKSQGAIDRAYRYARKAGKALKWADLGLMIHEHIVNKYLLEGVDKLCLYLEKPIINLKRKYQKARYFIPNWFGDTILDNTYENNTFHILAFYHKLKENRDRKYTAQGETFHIFPAEIENFLATYDRLKIRSSEEKFILPFVIYYLIKDKNIDNGYNWYNRIGQKAHKAPLSIAIDYMIEAAKEQVPELREAQKEKKAYDVKTITHLRDSIRFYERYITSLIAIVKPATDKYDDPKLIKLTQPYTRSDPKEGRNIKTFGKEEIKKIEKEYKSGDEKVFLEDTLNCFQ